MSYVVQHGIDCALFSRLFVFSYSFLPANCCPFVARVDDNLDIENQTEEQNAEQEPIADGNCRRH